jgi:hypothetical protein
MVGGIPLIIHMLDVAASADRILAREPEQTRERWRQYWGWNGRCSPLAVARGGQS